ncbi:hypothetical protein LWI28_026895 [Acer negundo]|uniref:Uncharacterized protein n=1 Tax=Acer negundo TaxID=4023 RepID=A0AAD5NV44_ACENE|nr:hypothetical protein LWI28_026895 [Acer negundo]
MDDWTKPSMFDAIPNIELLVASFQVTNPLKVLLLSTYCRVTDQLFLILNTLAFNISTQIILMLVYHRRLYFEVVVATISMVATYGTAIWSHSAKNDVKLRYVCMAALFPYLWRLSYQTFKTFIMN